MVSLSGPSDISDAGDISKLPVMEPLLGRVPSELLDVSIALIFMVLLSRYLLYLFLWSLLLVGVANTLHLISVPVDTRCSYPLCPLGPGKIYCIYKNYSNL